METEINEGGGRESSSPNHTCAPEAQIMDVPTSSYVCYTSGLLTYSIMQVKKVLTTRMCVWPYEYSITTVYSTYYKKIGLEIVHERYSLTFLSVKRSRCHIKI